MEKINKILTEIDNIEDFVKISISDFKINKEVANEIFIVFDRIRDIGLK